MSTTSDADYFSNHGRRLRFPWTLYHGPIAREVARACFARGDAPRVLVVGCGLEPYVDGGPPAATYFGCDVDARAIARCRELYPHMSDRLAVCTVDALPSEGAFAGEFDVVIAKEVVEHLDDPAPWAKLLAARVAKGGSLVLTTPNYGRGSTLPLLESTALELVARRDGFSRKHIHPTKFDRARLAALDVGPGMRLVDVRAPLFGWALVARWTRV